MKSGNTKGGFTLIEVLVASLLLGMLVTILTMVFNQSAIAWRTGKAGVSQLSKLRRQFSYAQNRADNLLPRVEASETASGKIAKQTLGVVLSAWNESGDVRKRAVGKLSSYNFSTPAFLNYDSAGTENAVTPWQSINNLENIRSGSSRGYIVGVLSLGPDGKKDTGDDITSWPENVQ